MAKPHLGSPPDKGKAKDATGRDSKPATQGRAKTPGLEEEREPLVREMVWNVKTHQRQKAETSLKDGSVGIDICHQD